jgi:hypothetical protein
MKTCNNNNKKCRKKSFQDVIYSAPLAELKKYKQDLDNEIRLGETAFKEGFKN